MVTYDHKMVSFEKLLEQYAGKQVYIDLWASWCLPCIRSMHESKERIKLVDTSKSVILYLSIDDDHDAWVRSSENLGLNASKANYRIANSKSFLFLTQIKLKSIPHYVLIDRSRKIASPDAPAPESKAFPDLLDMIPGVPVKGQHTLNKNN